MKKIRKKILSICLAGILSLSSFALPQKALAEAVTQNGSGGTMGQAAGTTESGSQLHFSGVAGYRFDIFVQGNSAQQTFDSGTPYGHFVILMASNVVSSNGRNDGMALRNGTLHGLYGGADNGPLAINCLSSNIWNGSPINEVIYSDDFLNGGGKIPWTQEISLVNNFMTGGGSKVQRAANLNQLLQMIPSLDGTGSIAATVKDTNSTLLLKNLSAAITVTPLYIQGHNSLVTSFDSGYIASRFGSSSFNGNFSVDPVSGNISLPDANNGFDGLYGSYIWQEPTVTDSDFENAPAVQSSFLNATAQKLGVTSTSSETLSPVSSDSQLLSMDSNDWNQIHNFIESVKASGNHKTSDVKNNSVDFGNSDSPELHAVYNALIGRNYYDPLQQTTLSFSESIKSAFRAKGDIPDYARGYTPEFKDAYSDLISELANVFSNKYIEIGTAGYSDSTSAKQSLTFKNCSKVNLSASTGQQIALQYGAGLDTQLSTAGSHHTLYSIPGYQGLTNLNNYTLPAKTGFLSMSAYVSPTGSRSFTYLPYSVNGRLGDALLRTPAELSSEGYTNNGISTDRMNSPQGHSNQTVKISYKDLLDANGVLNVYEISTALQSGVNVYSVGLDTQTTNTSAVTPTSTETPTPASTSGLTQVSDTKNINYQNSQLESVQSAWSYNAATDPSNSSLSTVLNTFIPSTDSSGHKLLAVALLKKAADSTQGAFESKLSSMSLQDQLKYITSADNTLFFATPSDVTQVNAKDLYNALKDGKHTDSDLAYYTSANGSSPYLQFDTDSKGATLSNIVKSALGGTGAVASYGIQEKVFQLDNALSSGEVNVVSIYSANVDTTNKLQGAVSTKQADSNTGDTVDALTAVESFTDTFDKKSASALNGTALGIEAVEPSLEIDSTPDSNGIVILPGTTPTLVNQNSDGSLSLNGYTEPSRAFNPGEQVYQTTLARLGLSLKGQPSSGITLGLDKTKLTSAYLFDPNLGTENVLPTKPSAALQSLVKQIIASSSDPSTIVSKTDGSKYFIIQDYGDLLKQYTATKAGTPVGDLLDKPFSVSYLTSRFDNSKTAPILAAYMNSQTSSNSAYNNSDIRQFLSGTKIQYQNEYADGNNWGKPFDKTYGFKLGTAVQGFLSTVNSDVSAVGAFTANVVVTLQKDLLMDFDPTGLNTSAVKDTEASWATKHSSQNIKAGDNTVTMQNVANQLVTTVKDITGAITATITGATDTANTQSADTQHGATNPSAGTSSGSAQITGTSWTGKTSGILGFLGSIHFDALSQFNPTPTSVTTPKTGYSLTTGENYTNWTPGTLSFFPTFKMQYTDTIGTTAQDSGNTFWALGGTQRTVNTGTYKTLTLTLSKNNVDTGWSRDAQDQTSNTTYTVKSGTMFRYEAAGQMLATSSFVVTDPAFASDSAQAQSTLNSDYAQAIQDVQITNPKVYAYSNMVGTDDPQAAADGTAIPKAKTGTPARVTQAGQDQFNVQSRVATDAGTTTEVYYAGMDMGTRTVNIAGTNYTAKPLSSNLGTDTISLSQSLKNALAEETRTDGKLAYKEEYSGLLFVVVKHAVNISLSTGWQCIEPTISDFSTKTDALAQVYYSNFGKPLTPLSGNQPEFGVGVAITYNGAAWPGNKSASSYIYGNAYAFHIRGNVTDNAQ